MKKMTDDQFRNKLEIINERNAAWNQRIELLGKIEYIPKIEKPSTSKVALWVVIIICTQIIIFSERMIYLTGDTSAIASLVGAVASIVTALLGYFYKSGKENSSGGIVYDTAMAIKERIIHTEKTERAEG